MGTIFTATVAKGLNHTVVLKTTQIAGIAIGLITGILNPNVYRIS